MIATIDLLKTALVTVILDFIWLTSTKSIYNRNYKIVQCNRDISVRWIPAIIAYTMMSVGFVAFILPAIRNAKTKKKAALLLKGAMFGLIVYGIFNATCMAVFRDFPLGIALFDTLWGTVLYGVITLVLMYWR